MGRDHSGVKRLWNIILAAVLVAAAFFLGAYLLYLNQNSLMGWNAQNGSLTPANGTQANASGGCGDDCLLKLALHTADQSYCANMSDARDDECWEIFAHDDLAACLEIDDYSSRKNCIDDISFGQKNASLCDLLSANDSVMCREKINPPCMDVAEKAGRELCLALGKNDSAYCSDDMQCLVGYARERSDLAACTAISGEAERNACFGMVANKDRCEPITGVYTRDYCYQLLAIYSGDYFYCDKIENDLYKFNCYTPAAIATGDETYCKKAGIIYDEDCYSNFSLTTGKLSGCLAISDPFEVNKRNGCMYAYARAFAYPSVCSYLSMVYMRTNCYANAIADATNLTVEKCDGVSNPDWRDKCFTSLAKQTNEKNACTYIKGTDEKSRCESLFP
ncbi:MAG: hypothetical protein WC488_01615 [Candidatus Micrarchaeia archaeon]